MANKSAIPSSASRTENSPAERLDLNTASQGQLQRLRGIGPAIAGRIVEYRRTFRPFANPAEITSVPGVSLAMYKKFADQVYVSNGEHKPLAPGPNGAPASGAPASGAPAAEKEPSGLLAAPASTQAGEEEDVPESMEAMPEAMLAEADDEDTDIEEAAEAKSDEPAEADRPAPPKTDLMLAPEPERRQETPAAQPEARPETRRDWPALIGMAVLGAILGAVLALAAIAGLNRGTLVLNEQADVVALTDRTDELTTRADSLTTASDALRTRLDALDGLTSRMDEAEAALTVMTGSLDRLETETAALGDQTEALAGDIETIRSAADRFDAFLDGLRLLLTDPAESAATAAPAATATPAPAVTATPVP